MPAKKNRTDKWTDLTWNDLEEWAGRKIVSRGKNYQRQERVSDIARTDDGSLLAWVNGTELYATKVAMGEDGLPVSICTCPYEFDCKHGVAVVIEYLEWIENNRRVPKAKPDDDRLELLEDEDGDDESDDDENTIDDHIQQDIDLYLKGLTKAKLIDLIHELAGQHPEMARDLSDRRQLKTGDTKGLVARLKREIRDIGDEPGWQNYWNHEGYTPDYSGIRQRLETLLKAGHTDTVLTLGRELIATGMRQVAESHDEGETAMEIAACLPVIVEALDRSSLDDHEKLNWALDIVLADEYDICEDFAEYLHRNHPKSAWHTLADRLLSRLEEMKRPKGIDNFSHTCERDRLSDWTIHALDRAGRKDEIIPLCEAEAKKTGNYERVVKYLVSARRYEAAERWIHEGLRALKDKWPGTAAGLRNKLQEIRTRQKNWPAVAAIQVEEFVRRPSQQAYTNCQKTAAKAKDWPKVRESLLTYLEKGEPPWKQKSWPLPETGLDAPKPERKDQFPLVSDLIEMALLEKKPEQVLYWYDRLPKKRYGWHGVDDDAIATAVQTHAPDRAVAIWQQKAEQLITLVKPKAYQEAGKYLRKASKVMAQERKIVAWDQYLLSLREHHARKPRLIEVLDSLEDKPIIKKTARSK
jgi:uncharacterized Zn finger protein